MPVIVHNKLVRDLIPRIIEESGKKALYKTLSQEEYYKALVSKLSEEVQEFQRDDTLEEIADILEVIEAILAAKGSSMEKVKEVQRKKKEARGSFEKKLFLVSVE